VFPDENQIVSPSVEANPEVRISIWVSKLVQISEPSRTKTRLRPRLSEAYKNVHLGAYQSVFAKVIRLCYFRHHISDVYLANNVLFSLDTT